MGQATTSQKNSPWKDWVLYHEHWIITFLLCLIATTTFAVGNLSSREFASPLSASKSYLLLICISVGLPSMMMKLVVPVWNKITPVKDRATCIEIYITNIISVFLSFIVILPVLSLQMPFHPLAFSLIIMVFFIPVCLIFWRLRSTHYSRPEELEVTSTAQTNGDAGSPPVDNSLAYLVAGAVSAAVFCIITGFALTVRGGLELAPIAVYIFAPLAIMYALLSPVFVAIGSRLWRQEGYEGLQYSFGAAIGLLFLMATSACRPNIEWTLEGLLSQWSIFLVFGIALAGFCVGGLALNRLYKRHPKALQFT